MRVTRILKIFKNLSYDLDEITYGEKVANKKKRVDDSVLV